MRMTNKIMQNNSLYNINQNKVLQDKLSTQMSTNKKLTRPSDDPVVAIRALRLRSSVSELTQYHDKNSPDAESWLKVTSDGLGTVTEILTDLNKNANKGANKDLTPDDIEIIVTNMKSLAQEFYSTGNLDYAGRYVFTGYRTDTPMSFTSADVSNLVEPIPDYAITEQTKIAAFDSINYTTLGALQGLNKNNYQDGVTPDADYEEQNVQNCDIHRLRLAYNNTDGSVDLKLSLHNIANKVDTQIGTTITPTTVSSTATPDPYETIRLANEAGTSSVVYVPETGEVLFSDEAYNDLINTTDFTTDTEIRVEYSKKGNSFINGDLRPEHYFACTTYEPGGAYASKIVDYNASYVDPTVGKEKQVIAYDVGYNQTIEINTTADEVFTHDLNRDITDLVNALNTLKDVYASKIDLENVLKNMADTEPDYERVTKQVDAINKAYDYVRENMHTKLEQAISKTQGYLDVTNVAVTDNGTRLSRLELIDNRLTEQKTTFKTLQSENEDIDIADVAIQLNSAELTYSSSLMATGKILQTTLMNYI